MTKSELFKSAHAMARKVVSIVGDYMVAFSYSLKEVYKNMNAKNLTMAELAEKALELGATKWEKGTMSRIYINSDKMFGDVFGLEQVAERSPYAGKFQSIGKAKVWFDANKNTLHSDVGLVRSLLNQNGFNCGK